MKKPLVRTKRTELKRAMPLEKTKRPVLRRTRELLAFVDEEPNPLQGFQPSKTQEQTLNRQIDAVGLAFRAAAKLSKAAGAHEHAGYGADYCVVVFQDNKQCNAFLEECGYPEPLDCFVDGLVLAEILKIKLPDAIVGQKKLKAIHNPKLTGEVTLGDPSL